MLFTPGGRRVSYETCILLHSGGVFGSWLGYAEGIGFASELVFRGFVFSFFFFRTVALGRGSVY